MLPAWCRWLKELVQMGQQVGSETLDLEGLWSCAPGADSANHGPALSTAASAPREQVLSQGKAGAATELGVSALPTLSV